MSKSECIKTIFKGCVSYFKQYLAKNASLLFFTSFTAQVGCAVDHPVYESRFNKIKTTYFFFIKPY